MRYLSTLSGASSAGLPTQTNNSGKFLTTSGNALSWANTVTSITVTSSDLTITNPTVTTSGSIAINLQNSGVTAGTYKSVTVDVKGRVTSGANPTTLAGYGITDAFSGSYTDLTNKPTLATVATTGSYTDLINKPEVLDANVVATLAGTETLSNKTLTAPAINSPKVKGEQATTSNLGTLTTGTTTIDLSSANIFAATIAASATVTLAFSNAPAAGLSQMVMLQITNGGAGTVNWPSGTKFSSGAAPLLTVSGVDMLGIFYNSFMSGYVVFLLGRDIK